MIRGSFDGVGGGEVEWYVGYVRFGVFFSVVDDVVDFVGEEGVGSG